MTDLKEIQKYLINVIESNRVEKLYNLIQNIPGRVNTQDKRWVACISQEQENTTVINAINEILKLNNLATIDKTLLHNSINDVCTFFQQNNIVDKPRIPFYILVLDIYVSK